MPTLLDIAKMNGSDPVVGLIEESISQTPEVRGEMNWRGGTIKLPNVGFARTIKGQNYKTLVRVALPTVGFRSANEGNAASASRFENRNVETFILNPRWECDKAVADQHEDGAPAYISIEAGGVMQAAMLLLARQFYYGRASASGSDAKGHPGLVDSVDSSLVVDAAGTTPSTGSSVWAVKFGPRDVSWVFGENGTLSMSDVRTETLRDSGNLPYTGYVQELLAYAGLQVGSKYSIGRIKNLTAEAGKGLTDARLGSLLSAFPAHVVPDAFFATRRSIEQLRASRTATTENGREVPWPVDFEGIPLVPTDAILNTEAIA